MKKYLQSVACSLTLLLLMLGIVPVRAFATVTNQSIIAPLYSAPGKSNFWNDVRGAGSDAVPFVVANPNNGPGAGATGEYSDAIAKSDAAGVKSLGYVQTNYQARPFNDSYKDIDSWYRLYPATKGIFIDQVKEGTPADVCYVASLYNHIKNTRPNDLVILGPSAHLSTTYEPYGDIFMNAVVDYGTYQSWQPQYPGFEDKPDNQNRFWHIIYGVKADQYPSLLAMTRNNNAGWVYATDKTTPAPFTTTPTFWQSEASDIKALPPSSVPNRGKTTLPRGCTSLSATVDTVVDTRTAKQSSSKGSVIISNNDNIHVSDANTTAQVIGLPKGVTVSSLKGNGWTCDVGAKNCVYGAALQPRNSIPTLEVDLQTNCEYGGSDATLRTTNYTGNRWETVIPLRPPFGCEAGTPAQKINSGTGGLVESITTQSVETTDDKTKTTPSVTEEAAKKQEAAGSKLSILSIVIVVLLVLATVGIIIWIVWRRGARERLYNTKL